MLYMFMTLVLDWLDALGASIAIVALLHPRLRPRSGLLPAWMAAYLPGWATTLLIDPRRDVDHFIAAARGCGTAKRPAEPEVRLLVDGRR